MPHPQAGAGGAGFGVLPAPALPMLCRAGSADALPRQLCPGAGESAAVPVPAAPPLIESRHRQSVQAC